MTAAAREDARDAARRAIPPGERSAVEGIRGLRWWVVVLVAGALAVLGTVVDLRFSGSLGVAFTVCFPAGALLGAVWVRRRELFATMVQPPLLLAACVPIGVVVSGSLPSTGGLTGTLLAVGGPMINGFPVMAVTTVVCLVIAFVRTRLQRLDLDVHDLDSDAEAPQRPPARGRPARPEEPRSTDRRPGGRAPDERRSGPPAGKAGTAGRSGPSGKAGPTGKAGPADKPVPGGTADPGGAGRPARSEPPRSGTASGPPGRRPSSTEKPGDGPAPGVRRVPGAPTGRPRPSGPPPPRPQGRPPRPPGSSRDR